MLILLIYHLIIYPPEQAILPCGPSINHITPINKKGISSSSTNLLYVIEWIFDICLRYLLRATYSPTYHPTCPNLGGEGSPDVRTVRSHRIAYSLYTPPTALLLLTSLQQSGLDIWIDRRSVTLASMGLPRQIIHHWIACTVLYRRNNIDNYGGLLATFTPYLISRKQKEAFGSPNSYSAPTQQI